MKQTPRLAAAILAACILILSLFGFNLYATRLEERYVNALAPLNIPQTVVGSAVQRAALQKSDILPVFGSSEVTLLSTPYQANKFFGTYPTGFTVMNISNLGILSITMTQELAALGPDLRGRKIVITIMPGSFFIAKRNFIENDPSHDFAMNFSRLHGYETIFSPYLSYGIKNEIAKRLSDFPETIRQDPFFKFAILHTASTSISDRALYFLIWPLGELQTEILRLQDHVEVMFYIWSHRINPDVPKIPRAINWDQERQNALAEQILNTNNNPYAVENFMWWYFDRIKLPLPAGSNNDLYTKNLLNSQEWTDLKVLLTVLQQLGAKPLILSLPVNDHLWQVMGVSEQTQDIYYTKFHSVVDPYNLTVLDFRQYGTDMYFSIDQGSHISREGWVHVDQTLDAFFHDRIH